MSDLCDQAAKAYERLVTPVAPGELDCLPTPADAWQEGYAACLADVGVSGDERQPDWHQQCHNAEAVRDRLEGENEELRAILGELSGDAPRLPAPDEVIDFGGQQPGSADPMSADRRAEYEKRIRDAGKRHRIDPGLFVAAAVPSVARAPEAVGSAARVAVPEGMADVTYVSSVVGPDRLDETLREPVAARASTPEDGDPVAEFRGMLSVALVELQRVLAHGHDIADKDRQERLDGLVHECRGTLDRLLHAPGRASTGTEDALARALERIAGMAEAECARDSAATLRASLVAHEARAALAAARPVEDAIEADPCTCTEPSCPRHRGMVRDGAGAWRPVTGTKEER